jgi:hypothetical protein
VLRHVQPKVGAGVQPEGVHPHCPGAASEYMMPGDLVKGIAYCVNSSVRLSSHYVHNLCAASRAMLMYGSLTRACLPSSGLAGNS